MDRSFQPTNAILFELLNGMDGLDEDHDVLFVLTTNRADLLEPALAARPGRIDQAVELPLPDANGRRRLLALYGEGLNLAAADAETVIEQLDGVSPAFIRELLRRAALLAAEESDGSVRVHGAHLRRALDELTPASNDLTQRLLGARAPATETRAGEHGTPLAPGPKPLRQSLDSSSSALGADVPLVDETTPSVLWLAAQRPAPAAKSPAPRRLMQSPPPARPANRGWC